MRDIFKIICACGGVTVRVDTTEEERKEYGCHRDSNTCACCVGARKCPKCGVRWMFAYEAPEV